MPGQKTILDKARQIIDAEIGALPVRRRPYLVTNTRPYGDGGRWLRDEPKLIIAPDPEALRRYMANDGFARPVYPSEIRVDEYYGPYLPDTERLLREPYRPRQVPRGKMDDIEVYGPRNYHDSRISAFSDEDYYFLKKLREDMEAKRRAREEYLDGDWYQD